MDLLSTFALLVAGHAVADYPLQGDFLARAKNRLDPVPGVPFYQALGAHAVMHGGMVGLITGSLTLGLAEAAIHALIDDTKCAGRLTFNQDQAAHIACKGLWCVLVATFGAIP